jgi:hypothetical protein
MTGKINPALAEVPLDYWWAKFEIRDKMLVWRTRPREDFVSEPEWRSWNARHVGKAPGSIVRGARMVIRRAKAPTAPTTIARCGPPAVQFAADCDAVSPEMTAHHAAKGPR